MKTAGIVIWLVLITAYIGYTELSLFVFQEAQNSNLEKRKAIFTNIDERFEKIETYINGPLKERIDNIEKFLDDNWGEK